MAEYIDRESVIKEINSQREFYFSEREGETDFEKLFLLYGSDNALSTMEDIVSDIPAADVVPVVRGEWILSESAIGQKQYFCSACKDDDYWKRRFCFGDENFCPNCGADMRGELT